MQIELTPDQVHWTKYAVINAIANLPLDDDSNVRQILISVLNKPDESTIDASHN